MIDTKIACQCGNRFKFGMDLVNGRAPDGLVCPTCGAPATPACNALVDFLSGKEPPPLGTGSRPLKEIRVVCACGARYKFDLELAEKEMPSPVICPGCQADLTALANEDIRGYLAKHAAGLGSPVTVPAAAVHAPPAPSTPASAASPSAAPASVPEAPAAAAPPAAAPTPAPAAVSAATLVSDPFGPPPPGKSSGPNLKPLEAPKPNRPPPGSKPASPPAKPDAPAAATAPQPPKPEAAKPAARPAAKPAASGEPKLGPGIAGAVVGALIGAALWFAVAKFAGRPGGFMALLVGALAGFGARMLGRGASPVLGGAACVATLVVCGTMVWLALGRHVDAKYAPQLAIQYKAAVDRAQGAVNAKTDAELRPFIAQTMQIADMDTARVSSEALKAFQTTELPKLRAFLADKDARAKFEARQLAIYRSAYPLDEAWDEAFGMLGLLWLLAGVIGAAKLGMK